VARSLRQLRGWSLGAVALALLLLAPAWAAAETLYIKNDLKGSVIVQSCCVVRGRVVRNKPITLKPGETAAIVLPGNKLITIQDARLLRSLYQATITASVKDQSFDLKLDSKVQRLKMSPSKAKAAQGEKGTSTTDTSAKKDDKAKGKDKGKDANLYP
jgi:hypothetical protein